MLGIRADDEVFLRLHDERRADQLFELIDANRDHLRPWFSWVDPTRSPDDVRKFIRGTLEKLADGSLYGFDLVWRDRLVGTIDVRITDPSGEAEIGYWLSQDAQGHGIVTRAAEALVRFAFLDLHTGVVVIRCAKDNSRSRAVPERLGFTFEATLRRREVRGQDQLVYSMLRSEWEAAHG